MANKLKQIFLNKKYHDAISAVAAVVIFYLILQLLGITCPIKFVTGVSCPGCGMTRAWLSLLHFDFAKAVYYHPLFFIPPLALVIFIFKSKIKPSIYKAFFICICAIFIIVYFYRQFYGDGYVVSFHPENNILTKAATIIRHFCHKH